MTDALRDALSDALYVWTPDDAAKALWQGSAAGASRFADPAVTLISDLAALPMHSAGAPAVLEAPSALIVLQPEWCALAAEIGAHRPVSLICAPFDVALMTALLAQGVSGWWPLAVLADPTALHAALALDAARWRCQRTQHAELGRVREQLDERKWVDRAKGLLMQARGIHEDEAFRLLRGAAMHTHARMGEVSRSVVEAARWAEAINRAGQLRMLSQRLIKLAAQRLAGIEVTAARQAQEQAAQRVQENLALLGALDANPQEAAWAPVWQQTLAAWAALQPLLAQRPSPAMLRRADAHAETLLHAAETLTSALEDGGARRALHIINVCGRQRMRVQRLAKEALLASILDDRATDSVPALLNDFEAALLELERAPLSTAEIRAALSDVREVWLHLLRGLRSLDTPDGRTALSHAADTLLDLLDRMTASYEHSLQVIMA
jgi:hypothetical protein